MIAEPRPRLHSRCRLVEHQQIRCVFHLHVRWRAVRRQGAQAIGWAAGQDQDTFDRVTCGCLVALPGFREPHLPWAHRLPSRRLPGGQARSTPGGQIRPLTLAERGQDIAVAHQRVGSQTSAACGVGKIHGLVIRILRKGEVLGLPEDAVTPIDSPCRSNTSRSAFGRCFLHRETETAGPDVGLRLPAIFATALRQRLADRAEDMKTVANAWQDSHPMFTTEYGTPDRAAELRPLLAFEDHEGGGSADCRARRPACLRGAPGRPRCPPTGSGHAQFAITTEAYTEVSDAATPRRPDEARRQPGLRATAVLRCCTDRCTASGSDPCTIADLGWS